MKQSKKHIHTNSHVFLKIIDSVPYYIFWKNRKLEFLGCNKMFVTQFGYDDQARIIGKTDDDFPWSPEQRKKYKEDDLSVINSGIAILDYEETQQQPDGSMKTVLVSKVPLLDERDQIFGVLGIYTDITERKRKELELKEAKELAEAEKEKAEAANKAKTEFLENMRHDIRTPLTGITGFAKLIAEKVKEPEIKEYADNLISSSFALLDLLNEILEVIQVNSSNTPVPKKKFNLRNILQTVIQLHQANAKQKNLDLSFTYDENIPQFLLGDSARIHRIVLELVANALKFTEKGAVKLSAQLAKDENQNVIIRILVEDTGIGIHPEDQHEIYLPFKRLTPSYKGTYQGAGLGLSIVRQYIDELKAEIYIESQLGLGSKFICVVPLQKPLLDEELGSDDRLPPAYSQSKLDRQKQNYRTDDFQQNNKAYASRVLIVEDNMMASTILANILSNLNCQTDIAEDGIEATQLASQNDYDLIFMDIGLPSIDGYETTRRMRLQELNKGMHVPIVALSAHVDEEYKQRCLEVGMNAVFTKPLVKEKAEEILTNFIAYRKTSSEPISNQNQQEIDLLILEGKIISMEFITKQFEGKEDLIENILQVFLNNLSEDLEHLTRTYDSEDWQGIQRIAHRLKGSASYMGAERLEKACSKMESVIKAGQHKLFSDLYQQMINEIIMVKRAILDKEY